MDVIHSAIWVSDLDRTLAFYVGALGLEQTREFVSGDGARNVFVAGEDDTEIQFKYDPDADEPVPEPAGFDHLAVGVEDIDAEFDRLVDETGCPVLREPFDSDGAQARVAFIEDPDGYGIELVEEWD